LATTSADETEQQAVFRERLGPADAAIFETFVVPRYMAFFGDLLLEMIAEGKDAQVVHVDCRTGYPDRGVLMRLPDAHIYGVDPSPSALELARAKAATMPGAVTSYTQSESFPCPLPAAAFSHALTLHPAPAPEDRGLVIAELARLLAPAGQALVAMPLRGSFPEIADLLREYALKQEADDVTKAVDASIPLRPTVEVLGAELEEAGFQFVDVEMRTRALSFQSARDFFEDPVVRLVIMPELKTTLGLAATDRALAYVREAIDKYWSEGAFELTVNVGCASGRKV
jgi:ubiquinone/menaquinone biosynthesis C-methylase UbiE